MFDYENVRREVHEYCDMADDNTFDEAGIVDAIRNLAYDNDVCVNSIDDIDPDLFDAIVQHFDTGKDTHIL